MAERDNVGPEPNACSLQECMPGRSRSVFNGAILPVSQLADIRTIDDQGPAKSLGQSNAERLVAVSFGTQLMVEMSQTNQTAGANPIELTEEAG